jgi:sec-independent protein translocase protein TatC
VLEAKVSEYLSLIIQLFLAFGLAFQLPIIILILNLFKVLSVESLRRRRRLSIVINFILAGVLTPPDVISQLALAMPLLLLYEISILMCKLVENRKSNVGH